LTPLDDQARWITAAPEPDAPIPPMRLLGSVPGGLEEDDGDPAASPLSLLDGLMDARGLREPLAPGAPPLEALSGDADVLELRRDEEFATEAVSYLEPEPLDTAGNPITFLRDSEEYEEAAPLPEPALPPEPLPAPPPLVPDESRRARRDLIWEAPPPPAPAADEEPVTDRASIWRRSVRNPQEQGELFEAAPVEAEDYQTAWPPPPAAPVAAPMVFSPEEQAPVEPPPDPEEPPAEDAAAQTPAPPRSRGASKRSSVPSWDEIVFGAARTDT
jgi:hypothetical protein